MLAPDDFFLYPGVGYRVAVRAAGVVGLIADERLVTEMGIYDVGKVFSATTALLIGLLAALISLPLREGRGGSVGGEASSCHQVAGDTLHGVLGADVLEQVGLGAEADADAVDVRSGVERGAGHRGLTEAAALEVHLEGTELVQHDALAGEQTLLDVFLGGRQYGHDVGFRDGRCELNVLSESLEVIVAGLHGAVTGVVDAFVTCGIGAGNHFVSYSHSQ